MRLDPVTVPLAILQHGRHTELSVLVYQYGHHGKRTLRHVQHFDELSPSGSSHIGRLFRLPNYDAHGQEQKEAGKEHGEEHKQVNVQLILAEEHDAVAGGESRISAHRHKEARSRQVVCTLRQCQHQTILQAEDAQQRVALVQRYVRAQVFGVLILNIEAGTAERFTIVYCGRPEDFLLGRYRQVARVRAQHRRYARISVRVQELVLDCRTYVERMRNVAVQLGHPPIVVVQIDLMLAGASIGHHHERVLLWTHVQVQIALRHVHNNANVDVHVARLDHEEHHLARLQGRWFNLAFVCKI